MKQLLDRLGIPTPRHVCLSRGFSDQQLEGLRFPVVTKPVDMYGSRGLYVLNSPQEVRRYFGKASSFSRQKKILVEEYNDGYEFNLMAWVLEGKSLHSRHCRPGKNLHRRQGHPHQHPQHLSLPDDQPGFRARPKRYWNLTSAPPARKMARSPCSSSGLPRPGTGRSARSRGRFLGYEHELIEYSSGLSIEKLLLDYLFDENAFKRNAGTPFLLL